MAKLLSAGSQALNNAKPHLKHFWYYAKVELAPPKFSELTAIPAGVGKLIGGLKSGAWKNTTVKQAVVNSMVTAEVLCWFFIGEAIGKRRITGYRTH